MEEWKDIKGYEGLYQVSNTGLVKSLPTTKQYVDGRVRHNKGRTLPLTYKDGYTMVRLHKINDVKGRLFKVHVLVAQAFIDNIENKPYIDHINTIRDDNRVENLRWCTQKENNNNPISVKKQKIAGLKRFQREEERDKISSAKKKWFSNKENYQKFKALMSKPNIIDKRRNSNLKKVRHYDSLGRFLGEYNSTIDVEEKTGINRSQISNYCLGKTRPRDRTVWIYLEDMTPEIMSERLHNLDYIGNKRSVIQLSIEGEKLWEYSSIRQASIITGISETSICNATKGQAKSAGGYIWKIKDANLSA